jgi:glyoxylate reductase
MPTLFVTRRIADNAFDMLRESVDVHLWEEDRPVPREVLLREAASADGLLTMLTERVDAELLDAAPNLKVISNMAVGYDNVDVPAATARGVPIGNTPGVLTDTTADLAFALLMTAARRIPEAQAYVKSGQWDTWSPSLLLGRDIFGATLGIVGFGRIGQAMAKRGLGFGMRVLYHGGSDEDSALGMGASERSLDDLLHQSDFVSLHVPLKPETHHLIGARELEQMKPTAVLINTARGPIVDPAALYEALRDRRIFAAALDVTEPEPIPADHPLLTLDNCLIVPHIGSSSVATREKMAMIAAQNALAALRGGRLLHCVNPEVYHQA